MTPALLLSWQFVSPAAVIYAPIMLENYDELIMRMLGIFDYTSITSKNKKDKKDKKKHSEEKTGRRMELKCLFARSAKYVADQLGDKVSEEERVRYMKWMFADDFCIGDKAMWVALRDSTEWKDTGPVVGPAEAPVIAVNGSVLWQLVSDFIFTGEMLSTLCDADIKEAEYVDPFGGDY